MFNCVFKHGLETYCSAPQHSIKVSMFGYICYVQCVLAIIYFYAFSNIIMCTYIIILDLFITYFIMRFATSALIILVHIQGTLCVVCTVQIIY